MNAPALEHDNRLTFGERQRVLLVDDDPGVSFQLLANHALNAIVGVLFRVRLRDSNCAIKVGRTDDLRGLRLESRGWSTPTEICLRMHARGRRIGEIGVGHRERARPQQIDLRFQLQPIGRRRRG